MIDIYSLKMERELNERERRQALDILTPERKAKALRFRRSEDQSRGMAAGVLELYTLWKGFGIPRKGLRMEREEQGKPFLPEYPQVHYNLSHSGAWIVCAAGDQPLGIDVEQAAKYSERIIQRFFHSEEVEDILSRPLEERSEVFAEYWTMKESFMKLCGTGFSMPLKSFATDRVSGRIIVLPVMEDELQKVLIRRRIWGKKPICRQVELETGYKCAVCMLEVQEFQNHIVHLEECLADLQESNPPAIKADDLSSQI